MTRCKCLKLDKTRCTRDALLNSMFCWQHQYCDDQKNKCIRKPSHKIHSHIVANTFTNIAPEILLKQIGQNRKIKTIKKGVLTVSAYANFYPVCYIDNNNVLSGLDVDIMIEFGKLLDLNVNFIVKEQFDGIWFDPIHKISDVAIGGIGITTARTTLETEWTIPYFYVKRTLVYNKNNPVKSFPQNVTGIIRGTKGSTGYLDGKYRLKLAKKLKFLEEGTTDEDDIEQLKLGNIQGLLRGSFVGKSIVEQYPDIFAMVKPWNIEPKLVSADGEVFAFPTQNTSGIGVLLTMMLTEDIINSHLRHLLEKYNLN